MRLLYEQELSRYLTQSFEEVIKFAESLVNSNNAINWQKANELSFLLRRNNRHDEAVEVSRMMFETDQTVDKLNLYFVAVVDQGSIDAIQKLHKMVDDYVKAHDGLYQKHLFATWLKAANRILDDQMFEYVYRMVPSPEKVENSYIISQYYVYLNRHSRYNEVKQHYEKELSPNIQRSKFVHRYYMNACARMGYDQVGGQSSSPTEASPSSPQDTNTELNSDKKKQVFLVYGNNPPELDMVKYVLKSNSIEFTDLNEEVSGTTILQKFETYASESRFAIVLLTPADHVIKKDANGNEEDVYYPRQNVVLEWGYFLGKLGKDNIAVLLQEQGRTLHKDFIVPSDMLGTEYISMAKPWMGKLALRLKKSGFSINETAFS